MHQLEIECTNQIISNERISFFAAAAAAHNQRKIHLKIPFCKPNHHGDNIHSLIVLLENHKSDYIIPGCVHGLHFCSLSNFVSLGLCAVTLLTGSNKTAPNKKGSCFCICINNVIFDRSTHFTFTL